MRHPYFVERLTDDMISKCWEDSSRDYSGNIHYNMRKDIIFELKERKILRKDRTLLDIGCGPGTYAIPMSSHVKQIDCIDSSMGMLNRLLAERDWNNVKNISVKLEDWRDRVSRKTHDVVFTSLCPPTNTPESILKMENCALKECVYISSANKDPVLSKDLWKRLGKNYSFEGYNTRYPFEFLKECGRNPSLKMFSDEIVTDRSLEEAVQDEIKRLSVYTKVDEETQKIIMDVYSDHAEDSRIIVKSKLNLGLLTWTPCD